MAIMIAHIFSLVSLLLATTASAANAPMYCGNSTDQVALVTIRSKASNAAKIDFCSKGSSKIHCSGCTRNGTKGVQVYTDPVTVGIGSDVGFLLFAEDWVSRVRTEGLYPSATGKNQTAGWPRNYTLPKFPSGPQPPDPSKKNNYTDGCRSDSDCTAFFGNDKPFCWCDHFGTCEDEDGQFGGNCTATGPSNGCAHATSTGVMACSMDAGMRRQICGVFDNATGVWCDGSICMMCTHACDTGRMPGFDCSDMLYLSDSCNAPDPTLREHKTVSC